MCWRTWQHHKPFGAEGYFLLFRNEKKSKNLLGYLSYTSTSLLFSCSWIGAGDNFLFEPRLQLIQQLIMVAAMMQLEAYLSAQFGVDILWIRYKFVCIWYQVLLIFHLLTLGHVVVNRMCLCDVCGMSVCCLYMHVVRQTWNIWYIFGQLPLNLN